MKNQTTTEINTTAAEVIVAGRNDIDVSAYLPNLAENVEETQLKDEMRAYTKALTSYKITDLRGLPRDFKVLGAYIAEYIAKFAVMNEENKKKADTFKGYEFTKVNLIKNLLMQERTRVFKLIKSGASKVN